MKQLLQGKQSLLDIELNINDITRLIQSCLNFDTNQTVSSYLDQIRCIKLAKALQPEELKLHVDDKDLIRARQKFNQGTFMIEAIEAFGYYAIFSSIFIGSILQKLQPSDFQVLMDACYTAGLKEKYDRVGFYMETEIDDLFLEDVKFAFDNNKPYAKGISQKPAEDNLNVVVQQLIENGHDINNAGPIQDHACEDVGVDSHLAAVSDQDACQTNPNMKRISTLGEVMQSTGSITMLANHPKSSAMDKQRVRQTTPKSLFKTYFNLK